MSRLASALTALPDLSPAYVERLRVRFWAKVQKSDGCWLWTGAVNSAGYGNIGVAGRNRVAHRIAWLLERGDLPAGLVCDHTCRTPACVNPAHLEPVAHAENVRRGLLGVLHTHCANGHDVREASARTTGGRCRACYNADQRAWRESRRAA